MRFIIANPVMGESEETMDALDQIAGRVADGLHAMEIPDADLLQDSNWYKFSRSVRQKLLEEIAASSLYERRAEHGPHSKIYQVDDPVSAQVGRNLANATLRILVENAFSDAALVQASVLAFGSEEGKDLMFGKGRRVDPVATDFMQAGGNGEVLKLVEQVLADAAERNRPPRLVVITDSDGQFPGDVHEVAADIRRQCAHLGIPCPEMNKRTAENYLPDSVWDKWAEGDKWREAAVDALQRMTVDQRDYLRLGKQDETPWEKRGASLFSGVSQTDHDALTRVHLKGKGKNMTVLGLVADGASFDPTQLEARDQTGDLKRIVQVIESEL